MPKNVFILPNSYLLYFASTQHTSVSVRVSGNRGASVSDSAEAKNNRPGFVALGTGGYYPAQFDNFSIDDPA